MKERPILFNSEMVRAILDDRKTMTRRVVKPQPYVVPYRDAYGNIDEATFWRYGEDREDWPWPADCPYGCPGDLLWVRETHTYGDINYTENEPFADVYYRADDICLGVPVSETVAETVQEWVEEKEVSGAGCNWRPSIFMPRWASRITLKITNVRIERLQDISEEDAKREGVESNFDEGVVYYGPLNNGHADARIAFSWLWDSINAKRGYSWEANPWVWVIEFGRTE